MDGFEDEEWLDEPVDQNGHEDTVDDDEGYVDRKVKDHILSLRRQVDDDERHLYAERRASPDHTISVGEANHFWGISVRQYLRGIKRLWGDDDEDDIKGVNRYWGELTLGEVELVPPDTDGYEFSVCADTAQYSDIALKRFLGIPITAELPRVKTESFEGLRSVLETNRIEASWVVTVDDTGPSVAHETIRLQRQLPVPKHILENAVEAADNFLQQAGLGFSTGGVEHGAT